MTDYQLLYLGGRCYLSGLLGGGVECFLCTGLIGLRKSSFVEKQVNAFDLIYDLLQVDGIRTIGLATGGRGRTG